MLAISVIGDGVEASEAASKLAGLGFTLTPYGQAPVDAVITFDHPAPDLPEGVLHLAVGEDQGQTPALHLPKGAHPIQIAGRLRAVMRLSVLEQTARLRVGSAHDAGAPPPPVPLSDEDSSILFVGAPGPSFMRLQYAMSKAGIQTIAAFSTFNAFDYLHERSFDAVILNTRPDPGLAHTVCSAMRRNTRLYHTPALLLSPERAYPGADEAYARGASDILWDNASEEEMRDRIMALAGERRRRRLAKAQLEACRVPALLDQTTDLYNESFGRAHIAALSEAAHPRNSALSLVSLTVHAPEEAGSEGFHKALDQFAGMLRHCVRAEDLAVRLQHDRFLIALPSTPQDQAQLVANRISAITECTAYEGVDPLKPFRLEIKPAIQAVDTSKDVSGQIDRVLSSANVVPFSPARTG